MAAWAFTSSSTWSHAHQRYTIAATMCQLKGCDNPGKLTSHETFPPNRSATLHVQYPSLRIHSIVLACSWTTTVACGTSNVTVSWNLVTMLEKDLCWSNHSRSGMSSLVSFAASTFLWRCKHHLLLKLASRSCTKFTQHWEPAPCNIKKCERSNDVQLWGPSVLTQQFQQNSKIVLNKKQQREIWHDLTDLQFKIIPEIWWTTKDTKKTTNTWMFTVFRPSQFSMQLAGKFTVGDPEISQLVWAPVASPLRAGTAKLPSFPRKSLINCIQNYTSIDPK